MKRKVIEVDEARCDGCGQCVEACHEGALRIVGGKAHLVADALCDGLAACLGECPQGALAIVEREAPAFDAAAVEAARRPPALRVIAGLGGQGGQGGRGPGPAGCPGSTLRALPGEPGRAAEGGGQPSALGHWPVQLMLVPPQAPFLVGADLLVCADCVPFAVPDFHARYLAGRAVLVGCPKLDDLGHYAQKLAAMVRAAGPRRLTVARMEVPCCRGLAQAAIQAAQASDQTFPVEEHVVGVRGGIERSVVR